jgi:hypothetical protein
VGWDETMHAEYPAVRMLLSVRDGQWENAWRALHDCRNYPFVWPVSLAVVQSVTGVSEMALPPGRPNPVGGRRVRPVPAGAGARREPRACAKCVRTQTIDGPPWLALVFAATSPLALSYSGTLFLEIPFVVVSIFALRAWMLRGRGRIVARELAAGAWLTLGIFTKFNYGLLLGFGLAIAWCVELALAARAGRGRAFAQRGAWLALVPALGLAWWFVLPLPLGLEMASAHRAALVDFLGGNLAPGMRTAWFLRPLHATCFLVWAPRVFLFLVVAAFLTLAWARSWPVWMLWIAWIASTVPVLLHPFHLDRFLLPGAVFLWLLASLGVARALPTAARGKLVAVPLLALGLTLRPDVDSGWMLNMPGLDNPGQRAFQEAMLAELRDLRPGRRLETNGFTRSESERLLDLLQPEVRADDRVAWVGMTQNFSPAALHVGLVERGAGASEEILRGELSSSYIVLGTVDPSWSRERLLDWAARYTLILTSDPVDLAGDPGRQYLARYRDELIASGRFEQRELGEVVIERLRGTQRSRLIALRPR